ncbi:MAG: hypothetical protein V8R52_13610 [Coprobacter fastidiosus]
MTELFRIKLEADYLKKLAFDGGKNSLWRSMKPGCKGTARVRASYHENNGFARDLLIVQDLFATARNMGVWVGPGRGSAAGSAVALWSRDYPNRPDTI